MRDERTDKGNTINICIVKRCAIYKTIQPITRYLSAMAGAPSTDKTPDIPIR